MQAAPSGLAAPTRPASAAAPAIWNPDRVQMVEALWGEGFVAPGGATEALRLAKPLGLSKTTTLLLLGAGLGGPPAAVAAQLGCWVAAFETDSDLVSLAQERRRAAAKRVTIEEWDPAQPRFRPDFYNHALALEPLRGAPPAAVLDAIAGALRLGGQLVMTELVAEQPLAATDPVVAAWCRVERRPADLPSTGQVTNILRALGFDVRVVEDVSERHLTLAMAGWHGAIQRLKAGPRPSRRQAAALVAEAELWLCRLRLLRERRLRLIRWHALSPG